MADDLMNRVRFVLETIEHATVATVSDQGSPWNTPVYFARDERLLYWTSRLDAQHSVNIRQNGKGFVVIYDSRREDASGAAVYVDADVIELTEDGAIEVALERIYHRRGKPVPHASEFSGASAHRVYRATALRVWTNVLHASREPAWDERIEIILPDNRGQT